MGAAKRTLLNEPASFHEKSQDRVDSGDLESFSSVQWGEESGESLRQHGFATSGCPTQQEMVAPGRGDLKGPAPMGLAVNIAQVCWAGGRRVGVDRGGLWTRRQRDRRQFGGVEEPAGLEHRHSNTEILGRPDLESIDQVGFSGVGACDHQGPRSLLQGLESEGEDAPHRPQTAVKTQFAAAPNTAGRLGIELATGYQQGQGDG
jgi:hypothetical protein